MAVRSTPIFVQANSHPAEETRLMLGGMLGASTGSFTGGVGSSDRAHGIINSADLAVTQNGTPNMSVNVATGGCFIRGTQSANQGAYHLWNDASINVAIAASDATNPRRDLVIAQVRDAAYSGASNDARIVVVTGTPAASPSDPSLTSFPNALVLARVAVAAGVTSITTANITDLRYLASPNNGYRFVSRLILTSNTTFTKATYPWLRALRVICQGAGGGGGAVPNPAAGQLAAGCGGGGGAYAESFITDIAGLASSVTVTVGTKGNGGAAGANAGAAGTASSFGATVSADGGGGGSAGYSGTTANLAYTGLGTGGASTTGDIAIRGDDAKSGFCNDGLNIQMSAGGVSVFGRSRSAQSNRTGGFSMAGYAGTGYGSGGNGASAAANAGAQAGGDGAPGLVIIELYA